ncbi:MAG TPA: nickel-binding protein [Flavitalea sp.]|nr:nickel-binding protein [Flavitalea sp.]
MPLYMDVHIVPGVKAKNVAEAHYKDLIHQEHFSCKCMTYWIDEVRESIFCLIEAPNKDAVKEMHSKAHGLVPNKIVEVSSNVVQSFLGRIYDPEEAEITADGLKVFEDPSFRILMVTQIDDTFILENNLGKEYADGLINRHNDIVRRNITRFDGTEVEHEGNGFIVSFSSASRAVSCALHIQKEMADADAIGFKVGINCGEPIESSNKLFGDTIQFAKNMCSIAKKNQVTICSAVKNLVSKDFQKGITGFVNLSPPDEDFLKLLFAKLEDNWHNAEFDIDDYCKAMAMSRSQLYRKTITLTGLSPNILLKEYRLEAAREMMKKQRYNISQITFNSGFTSPSYFTKCFRKKYGILPMSYVDRLH